MECRKSRPWWYVFHWPDILTNYFWELIETETLGGRGPPGRVSQRIETTSEIWEKIENQISSRLINHKIQISLRIPNNFLNCSKVETFDWRLARSSKIEDWKNSVCLKLLRKIKFLHYLAKNSMRKSDLSRSKIEKFEWKIFDRFIDRQPSKHQENV